MSSAEPEEPHELRGDVPPLGIRHFLSWTAIAAAMFALTAASSWWREFGGIADPRVFAQQCLGVVRAVVASAAVTGLITLYSNRNSAGHALRTSGHWLAFYWSATTLSWLGYQWLGVWSGRIFLAFWLFPIGILSYMACCNQGRWRWLFAIDALLSLLLLFGQFIGLSTVHNGLRPMSAGLLLVMLALVLHEGLVGKSRDWVHHVGVVALFTALATSVFWQVADALGIFR